MTLRSVSAMLCVLWHMKLCAQSAWAFITSLARVLPISFRCCVCSWLWHPSARLPGQKLFPAIIEESWTSYCLWLLLKMQHIMQWMVLAGVKRSFSWNHWKFSLMLISVFLMFNNLTIPSTLKATKSKWGVWDIELLLRAPAPPSLWPLQDFSEPRSCLTDKIAAVLRLAGLWALNEQ